MATPGSTRLRPILWVMGLLLAATGWWYLSVYSKRAEVLRDLVETEASIRKRNGESQETLARLGPDEVRRVLDAYERQMAFVGNLLPIDTVTVELLPYVTEAASQYGLSIQGQRPVPRHRANGLVVDGITVTVRGEYHASVAMMTGLLSLPRITHLRDVQLRAIPPVPGSPVDAPVTETTFTLVTFSRGTPTALPLTAPASAAPASEQPAKKGRR